MITSQKKSVILTAIALLAIFFIPMDGRGFSAYDVSTALTMLGAPIAGLIFIFGWNSEKNWVQILKGAAFFGIFSHALPWAANFNIDWLNQYISVGAAVGIVLAFVAYRFRGQVPSKYHTVANYALYILVVLYFLVHQNTPDTTTRNVIYGAYCGFVSVLTFVSLMVTFSQDGRKAAVHTFINIMLLVFMAANTIHPIAVG